MRALLPVSALLLAVAILLTGNGLLSILVPVRARLEGFSAADLGILGSAYFFGFGLGCLQGPRLTKAVGHIRTFTAMTATAAAAVVLLGLFPSPPVWWCLRMLLGICFAVLYMVIESWLNEQSTNESRGFVLSIYMVLNLTVLTVGQMLLPLYDARQLELFAVVALLVSLAAVPVALSRGGAPAPIRSAKVRIGHLFRISPSGMVTCAAVGLANGSFWALGPIFAQSEGLDESGIALFMSAAVIGGALGTWPLGRLSDRIDRRWVIVLAATLSVAAGMAIVMRPFGGSLPREVLAAIWGAVSFPLYSLAVAHANDCADPADFVETSSGLLLVYAAGAVAGPMAASSVIGSFGAGYLFAYTAAVYAALVVYVVWRKIRQEAPAAAHRVEFVEALRAAETVSAVFDAETQTRLEADAVSRARDDEP